MGNELKIGYITKECLAKLQDARWQALRGVWVELWTIDGPPSRCVVPVYTSSQNASVQSVDTTIDDSQPTTPGPFVYSAAAEIKDLRTQLSAMTTERDALLDRARRFDSDWMGLRAEHTAEREKVEVLREALEGLTRYGYLKPSPEAMDKARNALEQTK